MDVEKKRQREQETVAKIIVTLHHMMLSWQMRLERFAFFRRSRQSDRSVKVK